MDAILESAKGSLTAVLGLPTLLLLAWGTHRPFTKLMERWVPGFDSDTKFIKPTP